MVATLALFLALGGGAVLAANKITSKQIGKNAVKNRNLAKNAVKAKNLAKKSVTSAKLAKGAVKNVNVADGAVDFAKLAAGTNVVASASAGPIPAASQEGSIPLNPPLTVVPTPGQPLTLAVEVRGTLTPKGSSACELVLAPEVNGNLIATGEFAILASPSAPPQPGFPNGFPVAAVSFPIGLTQPGVPQTITIRLLKESEECGAGLEGRFDRRGGHPGEVRRR